MFCIHCGKKNETKFKFCINCGKELSHTVAAPEEASGQTLVIPVEDIPSTTIQPEAIDRATAVKGIKSKIPYIAGGVVLVAIISFSGYYVSHKPSSNSPANNATPVEDTQQQVKKSLNAPTTQVAIAPEPTSKPEVDYRTYKSYVDDKPDTNTTPDNVSENPYQNLQKYTKENWDLIYSNQLFVKDLKQLLGDYYETFKNLSVYDIVDGTKLTNSGAIFHQAAAVGVFCIAEGAILVSPNGDIQIAMFNEDNQVMIYKNTKTAETKPPEIQQWLDSTSKRCNDGKPYDELIKQEN